MAVVLITGANRGIGLELARQYAAQGCRVLATCRDPGTAADLKAIKGDVEVHRLDVDELATLDALAASLRGQAIDVLFNNAGINKRAASIAESAICWGVTGTLSLLPTVSPAPVMAQVMKTSFFMASPLLRLSFYAAMRSATSFWKWWTAPSQMPLKRAPFMAGE